jgi:integrase/recombinase XerD
MAIKRKPTIKMKRPTLAIEHTGFYHYFARYLETLKIRNYSDSTLNRRENNLRRFIGWCDERGLNDPQSITKPILETYQRYLYYYRQANGAPLSPRTQTQYLTTLRQFFKWLSQQNYLLYNPASELMLPKASFSLPAVLSEDEVAKLLEQPDINTPYGLRDRAMLELFYSVGLRRTELCNLQVSDLSLSRKTLFIHQGKGGKDRLLPVGARAIHWLSHYLQQARPQLLLSVTDTRLFLNDYGEPFRDSKLGDKVKRYLKSAGIYAPGSCHLLRHAMATHMLENGADLRYIQAMLGHAGLNTTQIYTHVSIRKLQAIHAATHPAKLEDRQALALALSEAGETLEE